MPAKRFYARDLLTLRETVAVPTPKQAEQLLAFMQQNVDAHRKTVLHCVGGLGRTGVAAALYLRQFAGLSAQQAIERVRQVRSPRAVENQEQENFIQNF